MAEQTVRKAVTVTDPETYETFAYVPGDAMPAEHVELIQENRRSKIFEDEEEEFRTAEGELIVARPNGNLAFDAVGVTDPVPPQEVDLEEMNAHELRRYANVNVIDLGGATKKADILARIQQVEEERAQYNEDDGEDVT